MNAMNQHTYPYAERFFRSKKAQETEIPLIGQKLVFFAFGIFVIGLLAVGFIMTTSSYVYKTTVMPKGLQRDLYITRFLSSPLCFAYQDQETRRVYPSYVDVSKFSGQQLASCLGFPAGKNDLCYELRLAAIQPKERGVVIGDIEEKEFESGTIRSSNFKPACTQGANINVMKRPVIIVQDGKHANGIMTISEYVQ